MCVCMCVCEREIERERERACVFDSARNKCVVACMSARVLNVRTRVFHVHSPQESIKRGIKRCISNIF